MFQHKILTLQTSFKQLLLGGGALLKVTGNRKEENSLRLLSQLRRRIRPLLQSVHATVYNGVSTSLPTVQYIFQPLN
jgi:hypothetical protein